MFEELSRSPFSLSNCQQPQVLPKVENTNAFPNELIHSPTLKLAKSLVLSLKCSSDNPHKSFASHHFLVHNTVRWPNSYLALSTTFISNVLLHFCFLRYLSSRPAYYDAQSTKVSCSGANSICFLEMMICVMWPSHIDQNGSVMFKKLTRYPLSLLPSLSHRKLFFLLLSHSLVTFDATVVESDDPLIRCNQLHVHVFGR